MKKYILLLLLTIAINSCNSDEHRTAAESVYSVDEELYESTSPQAAYTRAASANESNPSSPQDITHVTEKKIIKEGKIDMRAKNISVAKSSVDSLLQVYKGYYASEGFKDTGYDNYYVLQIRIPSSNYERFIAGLESGKGEIIEKSISARDITEQYYDIQTRLEIKRRYLERYRELVKKANTIKEILEIEANIRVLEEEIESAEGRLRLLSDQVNYSSLTLNIYQYKEYTSGKDENTFIKRFTKSIIQGINIFEEIFLVVVTLWPLWILLTVVTYFIRHRKKQRKQ